MCDVNFRTPFFFNIHSLNMEKLSQTVLLVFDFKYVMTKFYFLDKILESIYLRFPFVSDFPSESWSKHALPEVEAAQYPRGHRRRAVADIGSKIYIQI